MRLCTAVVPYIKTNINLNDTKIQVASQYTMLTELYEVHKYIM